MLLKVEHLINKNPNKKENRERIVGTCSNQKWKKG